MNPLATKLLVACMLASVHLTLGEIKGTECTLNLDCDNDSACINRRCIDPCSLPDVCGVMAECEVTKHIPSCRCAQNHTGNPFVECTPQDPVKIAECPCGNNSVCRWDNGHRVCSCLPTYIGDPEIGCRHECETNDECGGKGHCSDFKCVLVDACEGDGICKERECAISNDCDHNLACINRRCADPCTNGICGVKAMCQVMNHIPVCHCPNYYTGNPYVECRREDEAGCPCGPYTQCRVMNGHRLCSCLPSYTGDPEIGCRPECEKNDECGSKGGCCINQKCRSADICKKYVDDEIVNEHPCDPDPCSENEICKEVNGKASCQCRYAPYYRLPLSGCNPECTSKFHCSSEQTCIRSKCVDACPGDCGTDNECYVFNHNAKCRPKNSRPECSLDKDCTSDEACDGFKCVDPCLNYCDEDFDCQIVNQQPKCTCKKGYFLYLDGCYQEGSIVE